MDEIAEEESYYACVSFESMQLTLQKEEEEEEDRSLLLLIPSFSFSFIIANVRILSLFNQRLIT